jgi:hypothetical protein
MAVTFDASSHGTTGSGSTSTTISFTQTSTAGADVFVVVIYGGFNAAPSSVTYGGTSMTMLGSNMTMGSFQAASLWHLASVAGGAKTVLVTLPAAAQGEAAAVSYLNVSTVGSPSTAGPTAGTSLSQSVTIGGAGSLIAQFFVNGDSVPDAALSSLTGGTNRVNTNVNGYAAATASDATSTTTFTASSSSSGSGQWGGFGVVLSPAGGGAGSTISPSSATVTLTAGTPGVAVTGITSVAVDAVGAGGLTSLNNPLTSTSWTHTGAAGTYAVVAVSWMPAYCTSISSVTYGGTAMSPLGSVSQIVGTDQTNQINISYYGLASVPGGAKTVTVTSAAAGFMLANSVTFTNVSSVSVAQTTGGNAASWSQSVTGTPASGLTVQSFCVRYAMNAPTGGTLQYHGSTFSISAPWLDTSISTATTDTTYAATSTGAAENWAGLGVTLAPVTFNTTITPTASTTMVLSGGALPGTGITLSVGSASMALSAGTPRVIAPAGAVLVDALGAGGVVNNASATSVSWSHTAAAGAYGLVAVSWLPNFCTSISSVTWNSVTMPLLGTATSGTGSNQITISYYGLPSVASGTKTVAVTTATAGYLSANSLSLLNVGTVAAPQTTTGNSTTMSQALSGVPGGILVQSYGGAGNVFGGALTGVAGGTLQYHQHSNAGAYFVADLTISTATVNTTFVAADGTGENWAAIGAAITASSGNVSIPPTGATLTATPGTPQIVASITGVVTPGTAHLALTGGTPRLLLPAKPAPGTATMSLTGGGAPGINLPPFNTLLLKLSRGQSAQIAVFGDSTSCGVGDPTNPGWAGSGTGTGQFGYILETLGARYNVNAASQFFTTSTAALGTPSVRYTSSLGPSAPTLTHTAAGGPGTSLPANEAALSAGYLNTFSAAGTLADVIFIWTGLNDFLVAGDSVASFASQMSTMITNIQAQMPGIPIVVCTENPQPTIDLSGAFDAVATNLGIGALPLTPPLQSSTTAAGVWMLDTIQSFSDVPANMSDGEHPNASGYTLEAAWMLQELAPGLAAGDLVFFTANLLLTTGTPGVLAAPGPGPVISPASAALSFSGAAARVLVTGNKTCTFFAAQPIILSTSTLARFIQVPGVITVAGATMSLTGALPGVAVFGVIATPPPNSNIKVRYPAGPITPHGAYHLLSDRLPLMAYRSYDDSAVFNLSGALSIADRTIPESIRLTGLKGLIPPWTSISQKGASQDGATYVTSLYDPIDVELQIHATGRNPAWLRRVARDWIESWDAKQPGELSWTTQELGRWWAPVRWDKQPLDKLLGGNKTYQQLTWTAKAYNGFWQSYDHVESFGFNYAAAQDTFDTPTTGSGSSTDLGPHWTCAYTGTGAGYISAVNHVTIFGLPLYFPGGGTAFWTLGPILTAGRTVVCQYKNFTTTTNNQVISIQLGSFDQFGFPQSAYSDIWGRMANTGTPGNNGIRLRMGIGAITVSAFSGGTETVLRRQPVSIPALPNDWWTLICGYENNENLIAVQRNGSIVFTVVDNTGLAYGATNRGVGFGMSSIDGATTQVKPANVLTFTAGDNSADTQSGFLPRQNWGDQTMFDRVTCYGPGIFSVQDGPGSANFVSFGPLLDGQVMQLRTDPRKRGVVDLTGTPPPPQQQTAWQQALADFVSFATANNAPPLLTSIESALGITPPQGNPYSLLTGRFSDNAGIPAKPPGQPPQVYQIQVGIEGGNANSRIVLAGTPTRRYPY